MPALGPAGRLEKTFSPGSPFRADLMGWPRLVPEFHLSLLDQNWSLLVRSLETEVSRLESSNRRYRLGMVVIAVAAVGSIMLAMRQPEPRDPFVSLELGQGGQYMYGLTMSGQLYQMDRTTAVGTGVAPRRWFKVGDR
jgi:hypothetical protein